MRQVPSSWRSMTWLSQILSKRGRGPATASLLRVGRRGLGRGAVGRGHGLAAALLDARRLAGAAAQVIELGAADAAAAHDLDRGEAGRIEREDALDPLAIRDLAQREARVDPGRLA